MKKFVTILMIGLIVLTLSACQTMKGLGEDVEDVGEWVQEKAS